MASIAVPPALAFVSGAFCAATTDLPPTPLIWVLPFLILAAVVARIRDWGRIAAVVVVIGLACAGAALAADARDKALSTPLRTILDGRFGGFSLQSMGPAGQHDPIAIRGVLLEDAAQIGDFITLRMRVDTVRLEDVWMPAGGGVILSVAGTAAPGLLEAWLAGRTIEAPASFRRPGRYLNAGVPDFERDLALDGTTLFGSIKSGLVIDVVARGSVIEECAARVRLIVRHRVQRWVAPHSETSAAIVTAVLIGDRSGLQDDVRARLQAAGTYHIIAISGGNIAILAAATLLGLMFCGVTGRPAALVTLVILLTYAQIVAASASVWRATIMAALYLSARALDHRTPSWHALIITACLVICARPLDVRDPAFFLTFGATAALLEAARRIQGVQFQRRWVRWLVGSLVASAAVEMVLFPVSAQTFSRITVAGLVLNLLAVPLMGVVQMAGMVVAAAGAISPIAALAGWTAHVAATTIVGTAGLVDLAVWLTARVPSPPAGIVLIYYLGLGAALSGRAGRRVGAAVALASAFATYVGVTPGVFWRVSPQSAFHMEVFDVGQGDATLLKLPDGQTMLIDAGGVPGGGSFDIGGRVLAPALWAQQVRALDTLVLTHGDPDHIGGARAVISDFGPTRVWQGVPVPRHLRLQEVLDLAVARGASVEQRHSGDKFDVGGVHIRILHPQSPDWERQTVRNDDSVVIEARYGDVAVLLTGDIGGDVERTLLPRLTSAPIRILRVAHHGSRTSSSRELLEGWRPHVAIISCGRGNRFGHPAPEVVARLNAVGASIYRTDRDGQITVETDGRKVQVRTFVGGKR